MSEKSIEAILAEIRGGVTTPEIIMELAIAVQEAAKPIDLAVIVLNKRGLAKDDDLKRAQSLAGFVQYLHSVFPEWRLLVQRMPEPKPGEMN